MNYRVTLLSMCTGINSIRFIICVDPVLISSLDSPFLIIKMTSLFCSFWKGVGRETNKCKEEVNSMLGLYFSKISFEEILSNKTNFIFCRISLQYWIQSSFTSYGHYQFLAVSLDFQQFKRT